MAFTPGAGAVINFSVAGVQVSQRQIEALGKSLTDLSGVAKNGFKELAAFAGVGLGFGALVQQLTGAQREFDKLNASLVTATGSTAKAGEAFKTLQSFAATTPYSVAEATEAFIKMRNLGLDPSEKALRSYGNTAAAMGKGLDQMIEAVADAATGEFERLKEFGIKAKQNGDDVSLTFQGVTKKIGNNAKEIEGYLQGLGEKNFGGGMEARAATLDGAISNLGDAWESTMRTIAQNGIGEAMQSSVIALSNSLADLNAILDAVAGSAKKEGQAVQEAGPLHKALTTAFEAVAVVGVNVAYVLTQVGKDMGALAAAAVAVAKGDFKIAKEISAARKADAEQERKDVEVKSQAILGAAQKASEAQDAETANLKKNGADRLAQYKIELTEEEKKNQAKAAILDIENRLNGVNAQSAGELKKLKAALDAHAISQAEYARYTSKIQEETVKASTAYKDQVKALDLSAAAIKRRAEALAFANQQEKTQLEFMHRTGQMNDDDFIAKSSENDIAALKDQKESLEDQLVLAKRKVDNQKEQKELAGQIDLVDKQIAARRTKEDNDQFERQQQLYRQATGNYADLLEASQAESKRMGDQVRDQQDYIDQLGMTGQQIADVTAARIRDKAAMLDQWATVQDLTDATGRLGDESRKQAEALRKLADSTVSAERLKEQQQFWGDVERVAHDTFVSIADGGKDAFTRLKESAKNIFFEWLYQMTLKKWVINVGASADGSAAVAGLQSSSSMLTQGSSVLGAASNVYGALTGGMTLSGGLGSGFMGSLAGGLNGAGVGSGLTSSLGLQIGTSIADVVGPSVAGALSTGLGAIATALPWVGGALAVVGLAKAAFGHGDREYTSSTLAGSLGAGGFSGKINNAWVEKGGWFSSDRTGVDPKDADPALAAGLSTTYKALMSASTAYAQVLGLNADSIAARTETISIALGKDEAANQKAIADFFVGVGDQMARELAPDLDKFTKAGESASTTLQRLAADLQGTDQVAQLLGLSGMQLFGATGMQSMNAREQLIDAAGGLSALAQQAQVFNRDFLTDAERLAPVAAALDKGLTSLGLSTIPTTRDEFKALVQDMIASGATATVTGASQLAAVLSYADAFAQVHPQIDAVAEAAAKAAAEAEKAAAEAEKAAAAIQALKDAASTLLAGVNDQYSVLQKVVGREKAGIQSSVDAHTAAASRLQSLSQALHSAFDNIQSPEQKLFARGQAQAEIRADLLITKAGGMLSDAQAESLKKALGLITQDTSSQFSSYADYMRDLLQTQNDVAQLAGLTDDSLSVEQRSLDALKDQLARLDDIVANGQLQLDALNGQSIATLSLGQALAAFQSSIGAAQTNPVVSGTATLASFYQDLLGRAPDQAGLQYWQGILAGGTSLDKIRSFFLESDEYKKLHPFAVGTNFVPETMPALIHQGERIIPAADNRVLMSVLSRASNPSANVEVLSAAVDRLTKELEGLRAETRATATHTEKTSRLLTRVIRADKLITGTEDP